MASLSSFGPLKEGKCFKTVEIKFWAACKARLKLNEILFVHIYNILNLLIC